MKPLHLLCLCSLLAPSLQAGTKTWSGNVDGLWSKSGNWAGGVIPTTGDDLVFSDSPNVDVTNDIDSLTLHSLTFNASLDAYTVGGEGITLSGGLSGYVSSACPAGDEINLSFNVGSGATFYASDTSTLSGVISGEDVTFSVTASMGTTTLTLSGTNTYTGITNLLSSDGSGVVAISSLSNLGNTTGITMGAPSTPGTTLQLTEDLDVSLPLSVSGTSGIGVDADKVCTWSGGITGGHTLNKTGDGSLILTGDLSGFTGQLAACGGLLQTSTLGSASGFFFGGSGGALQMTDDFEGSLPIYIYTPGIFSVDDGKTVTLTGDVTGSEALTKSGSGYLVLSGDWSGYTGSSLTVSEGLLSLESPVTTGVTVASGAQLNASSTITGDVTCSGTFSPSTGTDSSARSSTSLHDIATVLVEGDLTLTTGSIFEIDVSPIATDHVIVTGTFTLEPGAIVLINPAEGDYTGVSFEIVTANTFDISSLPSVQSVVPSVRVTLAYTRGDELGMNASALFLNFGSVPFEELATGRNQMAVARNLDLVAGTAGSDLSSVINTIGAMTDIEEINDAFNALHPALFNGFELTQQENGIHVQGALSYRLEELVSATCREPSGRRGFFWGDAFGDLARQDKKGSLSGFHTKTGGMVLGIDGDIFHHGYLGLLAGYSYSDIHFGGAHGAGDMQSGYLGPYLGWHSRYFFANSSLIASRSSYEGKRKIVFTGVDRTARHKNFATQTVGHADFGFIWHLGRNQIKPFAAGDYLWQHAGAYREWGAGGLDLDVKGKSLNMVRTEVGLKYSRCLAPLNFKWIPSLKASWVREIRHLGAYDTARFKGEHPSFRVKGLNPNRSLLAFGAAVKFLVVEDLLAVGVSYDGEFGKNYQENKLDLQFNYRF